MPSPSGSGRARRIYHFADPTERLRYKLGAIAWDKFPLLLAYFGGILLVYAALSRLLFRARATA